MPSPPPPIATVLCDLDGVIWLAHVPIPGSVAAVAAIRATGRRVVFVTNNSAARVADQEAALAAIGIEATGDVVTSAQAAASLVTAGERVLVAGGPGVVEAVEAAGAAAIRNDGDDPGPVDAVIVGLHRDFDYRRLAAAASALHGGARLIGTNDDATYPTPRGPEPGGGALLAAVSTAAGTSPVVAGKPHPPMAAAIARAIAPSGGGALDPATVLMVGDRPETDGLFAGYLGCPFALVRSGVLAPGDPPPTDVAVAVDLADLAAVASWLGAEPAGGE